VYRRLLAEVAGMDDGALRAAGRLVGDELAGRYPDLLEEIEGIAAGAGVDAEHLLAVNARTELLAPVAGGECSLLAEATRDGAVIAQNWDWHPDLAASLVVWRVRRPDRPWFATLTEAGMLAKVGVSSAGVACGLNFLRSSRDGGADGVPIHVLLRAVLDRCDSVGGALRMLAAVPVRASACVTLAGADGVAVAIELSPGGWRLVVPDAARRLAHTNHFLAGPGSGADLEAREAPSTVLRLWDLGRLPPDAPLEDALRSHAGAPESVCRHERDEDAWPERRATLASVVLDAGARSMRVAAGQPCSSPYAEVALP
jgi:isopenicillin-N N-acyltransferase like protein